MNIGRMISDYRIHENYPAATESFLRFGKCVVKVAASAKTITGELNRYFRPFVISRTPADIFISVHQAPDFQMPEPFSVKRPDAGKTKIKEEYIDLDDGRVVRKRLTGMSFFFGGGVNVAIGPCLENLNQVVNFINNRYIEWMLCRGSLLGHAAGVAQGNRGLAVAGFSGAGKSTLALRLMERGLTFVSNDRLMVESNGGGLIMHGVAKLPRVNPGTILHCRPLVHLIAADEKERFGRLSPDELWRVESKYDVPIDACFGTEKFMLSATMFGLMILTWKPGSGGMVIKKATDESRRMSLLTAFIKETGLFFYPDGDCRMPLPSVANYARLLSATDVWEFSGAADFDRAADHCFSLLDGKD